MQCESCSLNNPNAISLHTGEERDQQGPSWSWELDQLSGETPQSLRATESTNLPHRVQGWRDSGLWCWKVNYK